jgi:hypothetical protein
MADVKEAQDRMRLDKINKLRVYENHIKTRILSDVPPNHLDGPQEFRDYLQRELFKTQKKIGELGG